MSDLVASLPPTMGGASTPWGATISHLGRPVFATVFERGGGNAYVALVLPIGHGPNAAKRRAALLLAWFIDEEFPAWTDQGFGTPWVDGEERLTSNGQARWAVRLAVPMPSNGAALGVLRWAADRSVVGVGFTRDGLPTREPSAAP
jgi:hypothetical protein